MTLSSFSIRRLSPPRIMLSTSSLKKQIPSFKTMIIIGCVFSTIACSTKDSQLGEPLVKEEDNQQKIYESSSRKQNTISEIIKQKKAIDLSHLTQAWAYYGDEDVTSPIVLIPRHSYTKYSKFNFSLKKDDNFDYTTWAPGPWTVYGSQWSVEENKGNEFILNLRFSSLEKQTKVSYRHRKFKIMTINQDKLVLEEVN